MNPPPIPDPTTPPGFWRTVRLLLENSRRRSGGRRERQRKLLNQRSKNQGNDWGSLGYLLSILFMAAVNILAAFAVSSAVRIGQHIDAERPGKIVVHQRFLNTAQEALSDTSSWPTSNQPLPTSEYSSEARHLSEDYGGSKDQIEQKLIAANRNGNLQDFVVDEQVSPGLSDLHSSHGLAPLFGSLLLLLWAGMLVCQGEGLELDLSQRRHPMWEWLFSHPVPPGAIFFAEMLSPIAANPIYWTAPLFIAFLFGLVYNAGAGFIALLLLGVPVTIALACLGKALEIAITLRFSPRNRGAMVGLMSWFGYSSMMAFLLSFVVLTPILHITHKLFSALTIAPWPYLNWFVGIHAGGSPSFTLGAVVALSSAALLLIASVWFSLWGANQGLAGNFAADTSPSRGKAVRFGKEPLYRKEFLWFIRDRGAIVQTILIPISVAAIQVFNLRVFLTHATDAWNYLCGAAIMFGTYFLWILGPKSLISEGRALWIALTWPRGLESLLKAKAFLWSLLSTAIVVLILSGAVYAFPRDAWKIALVGVGWFLFARSMAEKSVTLVRVTSESGESEPIPRGRMWAAQLGMFTFAIGLLTQQWQLAVVGIVFSWITAAAMWQNFRARLPYLYDPWSEVTPDPPTLMHAMIAISVMVELCAVLTGIIFAAGGKDSLAIARAISYAICAVGVSFATNNFLGNRGVDPREIWTWFSAISVSVRPGAGQPAFSPNTLFTDAKPEAPAWWTGLKVPDRQTLGACLIGLAIGVGLGCFGKGYEWLLHHIPASMEILRKSEAAAAEIPFLKASFFVMAVIFAPFAEEYLFRGLLFRSLDREWGGWRAILGSAAFFTIYHPPLAWPPVFLVGITNALLFKKSKRLLPCVLVHMVYNAIVLS
jgi:membrane protease YdiL (CAAX protease family)